VVLTDKGRKTYDAAIRLYDPRINSLVQGLPMEDLRTAGRLIKALRKRLEDQESAREA
jgi:DNA-binding MarR family transcriptional regulator